MPIIGYCRNLHSNLCPCFVCSKKFSLDNGVEDLLTHICFTHHIVVENIDRIADFKSYMEYYAKRYRESPLQSFSKEFVVEVTQGASEPREQKYYFLGEFSPEDENLRRNLHAHRLKAAERQQKIDLGPYYFSRHCFYCHRTSEMTNAQFVNHLRTHGFQLGHPEKLVYIDKFIEAIEDTFRNLHCLYCEMEFESCRALTYHMEKKGHLKIHPNNSFYDQFYMINYIEFGKTWLDFAKEKSKMCPEDGVILTNDDTDWSSWGTEPENITCLFCKHVCRSWEGTLLHLQVSHNFDFKRLLPLKFYQQVKIVNYIRRQILNNRCINCDFESENENDIVSHMERANHLTIPESKLWDHDEYFFCTLENDMLLCHLEDNFEDEDNRRQVDLEDKETDTIDEHKHNDIAGTESENDQRSLSQDTADEDKDVLFLKDQLKRSSLVVNENDLKNSNDELALSVNGENIGSKDIELSPAVHMGAGDSVQKMMVTEDQSMIIKKMNEFGDA